MKRSPPVCAHRRRRYDASEDAYRCVDCREWVDPPDCPHGIAPCDPCDACGREAAPVAAPAALPADLAELVCEHPLAHCVPTTDGRFCMDCRTVVEPPPPPPPAAEPTPEPEPIPPEEPAQEAPAVSNLDESRALRAEIAQLEQERKAKIQTLGGLAKEIEQELLEIQKVIGPPSNPFDVFSGTSLFKATVRKEKPRSTGRASPGTIRPRILAAIGTDQRGTPRADILAAVPDVAVNTVSGALNALVQQGAIEKTGRAFYRRVA